jgi:serine/threonine protein kinase
MACLPYSSVGDTMPELESSVVVGPETLIRLKGFINGDADFGPILASVRGSVVIDLKEVIRVNSLGIQAWIHFIAAACERAAVVLANCPPIMVQQFYYLKQSRGKAVVRSVLAPYYCDRCNTEATRTLTLEGGSRPLISGEMACRRCGGRMRFDDLPELYAFAGTIVEDDLVGKTLGDEYEILECVAAGPLTRVYRAMQHRFLRRSVAVKVLNASLLTDELIVRRFENEALTIGRLRHPNTVKLIDFGRTPDGRIFLVTEFLEGETLESRLKRGPLSQEEALSLLLQVADSLSEAHAAGVIHRDLKPANIFIEQIGVQEFVKVLDFGLAKIVACPGLTQPTAVFGTPSYMSPEQASAKTVDARSDYYALGVIAHECIAGQPLFTGTSPVSIIMKHVTETPVALREIREDVSPEVSAFVMSLLSKEPSGRPQSATELRARIAGLIRNMNSPCDPPYLYMFNEKTIDEHTLDMVPSRPEVPLPVIIDGE